jgi:chemotaxis protein methyltransferase CheR
MTYDVIFCRNVSDSVQCEDQAQLATKYCERLLPGGYLFIRHSESLQGLNNRLQLRLQDGGVTYQRTES